MAAYTAELRCMAGCDVALPVTAAVYRCPRCASLLTVRHDLTTLAKTSPEAWRALFSARFGAGRGPLASGVWGKREWIMPEVPDELVVTAGEGRSTLFWAERCGKAIGVPDLHVKMCGTSHTGSFKDLGMTVLVSTVRLAIQRGLAVSAIACASTGDTSAALAAYGAQCGLPVVVLLPRGKVSTAQLVQPLAAGARVFALDTDFDGCMAIIDRLASENLVYLANSMNALRLEGQKSVALELVQQLDWQIPDWVALPGGNLGNAYAVYLGFEMLRALGIIDKLPRLLIAQARHANPLYRAFVSGDLDSFAPMKAESTLATAIQIGNPVSYPRAKIALQAMDGVVEDASEEELAEAAARADRTGLYTCPHTAVALAAVEKLRAKGTIAEHQRVVVISTASGLKFTEFKVGYHEGTLPGLSLAQRNVPVNLPADFGRVADALRKSALVRVGSRWFALVRVHPPEPASPPIPAAPASPPAPAAPATLPAAPAAEAPELPAAPAAACPALPAAPAAAPLAPAAPEAEPLAPAAPEAEPLAPAEPDPPPLPAAPPEPDADPPAPLPPAPASLPPAPASLPPAPASLPPAPASLPPAPASLPPAPASLPPAPASLPPAPASLPPAPASLPPAPASLPPAPASLPPAPASLPPAPASLPPAPASLPPAPASLPPAPPSLPPAPPELPLAPAAPLVPAAPPPVPAAPPLPAAPDAPPLPPVPAATPSSGIFARSTLAMTSQPAR